MAKPTLTSHVLTDEDRYITDQEAEAMAKGESLPAANERLLVWCNASKKTYWMRRAAVGYKLRPSPLQSSMLHGARSGTNHFKPLYNKPKLVSPLAKRHYKPRSRKSQS